MTSWAKGGGGIKDFVTTALRPYYYEKPDDGGRGCQNFSKLHDVIYGRPLICYCCQLSERRSEIIQIFFFSWRFHNCWFPVEYFIKSERFEICQRTFWNLRFSDKRIEILDIKIFIFLKLRGLSNNFQKYKWYEDVFIEGKYILTKKFYK